ncbi:hypothetical protein F8388_010596 [Cannabis sativa]|uniref:Ycf2 N-terminal domain-containing protein n=1 Tax=Cannabis sativa TaxID=3483 RepID=A0A7J6GQG8_CANSA|nr:hypothetical protein F8388_010596 [Cannabis sativa]
MLPCELELHTRELISGLLNKAPTKHLEIRRGAAEVQNISSNIQYDSTRSSFVQLKNYSQLKGSSDRSRYHLIPIVIRIQNITY